MIDPDAPSIVGNHMIAAIEIPKGYESAEAAQRGDGEDWQALPDLRSDVGEDRRSGSWRTTCRAAMAC